MAASLFSLALVSIIAFVGPFLAELVPGHWFMASAFILLLGAVFGPHCLGLIDPEAPGLPLLKQLGLAFLFLIGGFGLEPKAVLGHIGRRATVSWVASLAIAFCVSDIVMHGMSWEAVTAFAISLTSTAFGKVEGVLRDRGLMGTRMGEVIDSYGATGELLPVVAIALLLEERSPLIEVGIMVLFVLLALGAARVARHEERAHTRLDRFVRQGSNAPQMMLRLVIAILICLVALGTILGADMIVAGFAAGFVLRQLIGEDEQVMPRIQAVANGFFIPVTFVLSGCGVDLVQGLSEPLVILGFIGLLVLVRGVPTFVSVTLDPETRSLSAARRVVVALYTCTAMSTVVAMTSVAVESGDMSARIASVLVFSAALTTILVPIATRLVGRLDGPSGPGASGAAGADPDPDDLDGM